MEILFLFILDFTVLLTSYPTISSKFLGSWPTTKVNPPCSTLDFCSCSLQV